MNLPYVRDALFTGGVDLMTVSGATDGPYAFPSFRLASTNFESARADRWCGGRSGTRIPSSRANARSTNSRDAAGRDPVDLRRELLADNPRTLRALEVAAEASGWGTDDTARGIVCSSFLSHSAQVTEVSLDTRGRVHVDRIVYALDCGITVNPDLIRAQVEGGLLFGLSAAAWGEAVLGAGGEILTQNFDRYPIARMRSVPRIEVHLIGSSEPPTGVGEVSVPSAAPALANAIAALTGTRIRRLPFSKTIKIY